MAFANRIKFDPETPDVLVWKFPEDSLKLGSQVIVNPTQEAIFVKNGKALDVFTEGTHSIETGNLPILTSFLKAPFGGKTPFTAEIWFVNKIIQRGLKWGTQGAIQLIDPVYQYPISVRAFGDWGFRISDSQSFVQQIVGAQLEVDTNIVEDYFSGEIVQKLSVALTDYFLTNKITIFEINAKLTELSEFVKEKITPEFERFGIEIVSFNIKRISIPDEEHKKIQEILGKKLEINQLKSEQVTSNYTTIQMLEALKTAAGNNGANGMPAFIGAALGMNAGNTLANMMNSNKQDTAVDPKERLQKLKSLYDAELITEEEYQSQKENILKGI